MKKSNRTGRRNTPEGCNFWQRARFARIGTNTATQRRGYTIAPATLCVRCSRPAVSGRDRGFAATSLAFCNFQRCALGNRAFTLIEVLVALAVMSVLGVLIVQMISATGSTSRMSNRLVDAASQARLAFDRIGLDLGNLVKRDDADFVAGNPAADGDALLFLSELASPGGNRTLSLVAYRLAPHPDPLNKDNTDASGTSRVCLLRAGMPILWDTVSHTTFMGLRSDGLPVQLSASDSSFAAALLPATASFDVLAPGVLQMVVGFQLYPDNKPVTCKDGTSIPNALGQIVYSPPVRSLTPSTPSGASPVDYIDLSRISAIVVGLVTVDLDSLKLLNASDAAALSAKFQVPITGQMPVAAWTPIINTLIANSLAPGILPVRQALRVNQRFYPINPSL